MNPGFLGAGVGLRRPHVQALLEREDRAPPVLELMPSLFFGEPELLERVAAERMIVLHDVFASLGTVGAVDLEHLERVAEVARRSAALAYTEHLAMTRSPSGLDLGHLIPLPRTPAQLDVLVDHVRVVQDQLALPVALELPTTTLVLPDLDAALCEGEFLTALVERSGCELILDVENLRVDAANAERLGLTLAVDERLASWPLAAVSHVQLAGGHMVDGWAIDSHAAPVPEPTWQLLESLRGWISPRTIIVERDANLPSFDALVEEAELAAARWCRGS